MNAKTYKFILLILGLRLPTYGFEIISWEVILRCADDLPESQGYDTEDEAILAAEKQVREDDFVVSATVKPFYWYVRRPGFALWGLIPL